MVNNFYQEKQKASFIKLNELQKELPSFCRTFFIGIEQRTEILTRLSYAQDLAIFFDFAKFEIFGKENIELEDLNKITAYDLEKFMSYLTYYTYNGAHHKNNDKAKARKLSSIRSLFKYLYNKDMIKENVTSKVISPKIHDKEIIRLNKDEVYELIENIEAKNSFSSARQNIYNLKLKERDYALVSLLLATGIRVSECVALNISDINLDNNSFLVTRKGGNQAILYFSEEIKEALSTYISMLLKRLKEEGISSENSPLFISLQNKRLTPRAIQNIVKKYAQITTPLKKISPHKLRSTYGTELYRNTKDIYVVAEVLGHKDINTTKKHYAAIGEDIKKEASNKVTLRKK